MEIKNKIIFLDVDGVLNYRFSKSYFIDKEGCYRGIDNFLVKKLKRIVDETDASIVLTSTWKDSFEIGAYKQEKKHAKYLSNKLRREGLKIVDKTSEPEWKYRGLGITSWLEKHPEVTDWVILDDETFDYREIGDKCFKHFVFTNEDTGLMDWQVDEAIKILNNETEGPVPYYKEEYKPE